MLDKVMIVSWLLTRRCNLKCSYCAITRNYKNKPQIYPNMKHYFENEMNTEYVIDTLTKLKLHNPDVFNIFYGGEPLLRMDLAKIINFCNRENINYTIISNNSDEIQPFLEDLLMKVDYINGFTASIDPLIVSDEQDSDRVKKSVAGFKKLVSFKSLYKNMIHDLVAEITVDNRNVPYIYQLVKTLTDVGISSDITFIDIAHNPYYDFSNITDKSLLVERSSELTEQFERILDEGLDIHMGKKLLTQIFNILPSNQDCGLDKNIHNITIDADGTMRTCLRIRGVDTPKLLANSVILKNGNLDPILKGFIKKDKEKYCRGCNWTCILMGKMLLNQTSTVKDLVHKERRV